MSVFLVVRPKIVSTVYLLWLLSGQCVSAQTCFVNAPRYNLTGDTVTWSMTIPRGHSCIRGVRFGNIQFDRLKLISPPQFGAVELQGSGFVYSPTTDFHDEDKFTLAVLGLVDGKRGSSMINVVVSVASGGSPGARSIAATEGGSMTDGASKDITPPSISFVTPADGATISGARVVLAATAQDDVAVANVQFIIAGKNIGSAIASPPYATTWDSTTIPDGSYVLYAVAQDTSGNYRTNSVHIIVRNK